MEHLLNQSTGYLVLESDIPGEGLLAGDHIYIDSDPQTTARLVVCVWDDKAHICQRLPDGQIWDYCCDTMAPSHAVVHGGALYASRAIYGYRR